MGKRRHRTLPDRGKLLVSTDLHGNLEDFERLHAAYEELRREGEVYWVLLGDLVHGPDPSARAEEPRFYDYDDRSAELVDRVYGLVRADPEHVVFVLGNHDHSHIGGPTTRKFHRDEAAHLESRLSRDQKERLVELFTEALLLVTTPCGAALAHGSPTACIRDPGDLDDVVLPCGADWETSLVLAMTTPYGQPRAVAERFLAAASRGGPEQRFLIHGHDRDEEGWFIEETNQACPVLFGALREHKRYVVLDLSARYEHADALTEGDEVRRLYPTG